MLGKGEMDVARTSGVGVSNVMKNPRFDLMSRALSTTFGTSKAFPVLVLSNDFSRGKLFSRADFLGGIGDILANRAHKTLLPDACPEG